MVPTASLCDLSTGNNTSALHTCRRDTPDYAADSSVPILDGGLNAIKKET